MTPTKSPRPARGAALAALALALAAASGCSSASDADDSEVPRAPSTYSVDASHGDGETDAKGGAIRVGPADPVRVSIPSIGVSAPLMRLGLNADRTVEVPPPDKGMTAGWYTGGAVPGERGAAVLIGHNDTRYGKAVFHDLKDLRKGARVTVRDARGATAHFTVTGTETVSKRAFPTAKVYGRTSARALRLITCDGAYDAQGHPVDNLIVYATANR
ncbi:class F sortase [Streptomyces sp. G45]|uniref:class F sortase n=1 Tax=Streptomyces sp. G45 TaxID=3406627 RepID=UPI003C1B5C02